MPIKLLLMISFVSLNTLVSQLFLKKGLLDLNVPMLMENSLWLFLFKAFTSPLILLALGLQGVGYCVWMLVISKTKLGLAFALSGSSFYLLLALASWFYFGETLTGRQWLGIIVISCGVILVTLPSR